MKNTLNKIKKLPSFIKFIIICSLIVISINLYSLYGLKVASDKYGDDVRYISNLYNSYNFDSGKHVNINKPLPILMTSINNKILLLLSEYNNYLIYDKKMEKVSTDLSSIESFYYKAKNEVSDCKLLYNFIILGNFLESDNIEYEELTKTKSVDLSEAQSLMTNYMVFMLTSLILFIEVFMFVIAKVLVSNKTIEKSKK